MTTNRIENLALRRALADARLRETDVAEALAVDLKTVQRWLGGRRPHPQHRWSLSELVGVHEYDLWPELSAVPPIDRGVVAVYPHRSAVPMEIWQRLFAGAKERIGVLVYSGLFLAEDVGLVRLLAGQAASGVTVRILLGDPHSPAVAERGREEGIGDAMAAKIRNAGVLLAPVTSAPGTELRTHDSVLYNSIYRADDEMLVNPHIHGVAAAHAPVLHLRRSDSDLFDLYADSFERVWAAAASK